MANNNQVSLDLSDTLIQEILDLTSQLQSKLDFLVNLTPEERKKIAKMGDKSVAFVQKSLAYAQENPMLVPPYMKVEELQKDMNATEQLSRVLRPLRSITEGLDDTIMLAGSEAYQASLLFYNSIKMAKKMNIPGTDSIYEDLSKRYPGRGVAANNDDVEVVEMVELG